VSTARNIGIGVVCSVLIVVGLVAVLYLLRVGVLYAFSTEGDVPAAESMAFPDGATVVRTDKVCGSGGCSSIFTVRPGEKSSAEELAKYLDTTFDGQIPGTFFDPRPISFMSEIQGNLVVVTADVWKSS
jgi:hypothetical protein